MPYFELRIGNGNDGNYFDSTIEVETAKHAWAFMECVIPNRFIPSHKARSHAWQNTVTDGDDEHIYATLHENFRGEQDMGAAYMTAEMNLTDSVRGNLFKPESFLDRGALIKYRQKLKNMR